MNNRPLKYLLSEDPKKNISSVGIKIRKFINPIFRKVMMLSTSGKLKIVKKELVPKNKSIIYAGTHGFHDDIVYTIKTIDKPVYLLYGSLLDFFKSFHGYGLWVNGVILVDRKNKQSRKASVNKMVRAIELGADIVMFPEGTWNKNESIPVQKLYTGIYDVAEKTGTLVVPIATILDNGVCYSTQGEAYDITDINKNLALEIFSNQVKLIKKASDLIIYNTNNEFTIKNRINDLLFDINNINIETKNILSVIDSISLFLNDIILYSNSIYENIEKNSIEESILYRVITLLKLASKQKKIIAVSHLRDKMCTLKWDMYKEATKDDFPNGYWENYVNDLISTTKGLYDHTIEDIAEYKNPDEISDQQVFSILDNVKLTNENAYVLALTRNKK